jgi:hypothetical protein
MQVKELQDSSLKGATSFIAPPRTGICLNSAPWCREEPH